MPWIRLAWPLPRSVALPHPETASCFFLGILVSGSWGQDSHRVLSLVEEDSGKANPCLFIQVDHGAGADTCLSCQNDLDGIKSKQKFTAEAQGSSRCLAPPQLPRLYIDLTAEHRGCCQLSSCVPDKSSNTLSKHTCGCM